MNDPRSDSPDVFSFDEFELNLASRELRRGSQPLPLRPRTWDVLVYLVTHAGQTVSRDALLREVWKGTHVGDETVATSIRELRRVFADSARNPKFVQTHYKLGYRFLAPVYRGGRRVRPSGVGAALARKILVGRNAELIDLMGGYEAARQCVPQCRLIAGAAGIGKSALVREFLGRVDHAGGAITGLGQCVEQRGRGEPYLPIMQLLTAIATHPLGQQVRPILRRHASQWWTHLPALHDDVEDARWIERAGPGFAPRMIREFVSSVAIIARRIPVVAIVEDLQWSDAPSIDALSALTRQSEPTRLLLIATLRLGERSSEPEINVATLRERFAAHEITLERLAPEGVATYLEQRLGAPDAAGLAPLLHHTTGGHPMFLVRAVEELIARNVLAIQPHGWSLNADLTDIEAMIPSTLAETVENQLARLDPEDRQISSAASVLDGAFWTDTVAAACETNLPDVETRCSNLAQAGYFEPAGILRWPDGTEASSYRFAHEMYRATLYERLSPALRQSRHGAVARRLEAAMMGGSEAFAATLAHHFDRAGEAASAIRHWRSAAMYAMRTGSAGDALRHLGAAIDLVAGQPAGPSRDRTFLELATARASLMLFTRGYADPDAPLLFDSIRTLCSRVSDPAATIPGLVVLQLYALWQRDFTQVDALDQRFAEIIATSNDPTVLLQACRARGLIGAARGRFAYAREQLRRALDLYEDGWRRPFNFLYRSDVGVDSLCFLAVCELMNGASETALTTIADAIARARGLEHPPSVSFAMHVRSALYHCRLEWQKAIRSSEEQIAYAEANELEFSRQEGIGLRNWAQIELGRGGDAMASLALAAGTAEPMAASFYGPYFVARLGLHLGKAGRREEAVALIDDALADSSARGGLAADAELLRVQASLAAAEDRRHKLAATAPDSCEETLRHAMEVAQAQGARLFFLRAAVDLARLLRTRRRAAAGTLVADALASFGEEGRDLPDVRAARRFLSRS